MAIAPEKDDIFITVNVDEGEVYTVGDVKLAGNMVVPEEQLRSFLLVQPGQTFSRKLITADPGTDAACGSGRTATPSPRSTRCPQENPETKTVDLTFFVDPGNRVYVRHINFENTSAINDEVLRREMRQLEGSYLSNALVERSKQRLQRLPYIEKVEFETNPVPGTPDLVDVSFDIKEGLPGQFSGGIGYSESQSFILNGSFVHTNFMGTGERVAVELAGGRFWKVYSFSHTDPYTNIDGVSRSFSMQYRDITQFVSASSDFSTKSYSASLDYGYPISEYQAVRFGVTAQQTNLITNQFDSAREAVDWVRNNGNPYIQEIVQQGLDPITGEPIDITTTLFGTKF